MSILRTADVVRRTGLSRTTLWRLERKGDFPTRVHRGLNSVGWRVEEIDAWIDRRPRGITRARLKSRSQIVKMRVGKKAPPVNCTACEIRMAFPVCDKEQTMAARISVKRRRRASSPFLKQVPIFIEGDLLSLLKLDLCTPLGEFGPTRRIKLADDGRTIVVIPGWPLATENR